MKRVLVFVLILLHNYYKDVFFYITGQDMMEEIKEGIEDVGNMIASYGLGN